MLKKLLSKLRKPSKKGFTLIEVVIVLAIAGLIFVIVFLAVSQAQASRRDTQRSTAVNQLLAAANQFAGNNNGAIPVDGWCGNNAGTASAAPTNYWTPGNDPSGDAYLCQTATPSAVRQIRFDAGATCGTAGAVAPGQPRQFVAQTFMERGGLVCTAGE